MTTLIKRLSWDEVQPQGSCPWKQCAKAHVSHAKGARSTETVMYVLIHEDFKHRVTPQLAQMCSF